MQNFSLRQIALTVPFRLQIAIVIILGILLISRVVMTKQKTFKENLLKLKELKSEVIKRTLKELDILSYLNDKLRRDKEVIGLYNTETIILALQAVNRIEKLDQSLNELKNAVFVPQVKDYTQKIKVVLSTIYHLETNLYETKKKSEQLLLSYDRAFYKLNSENNHDRTEEIKELKQNFKKEMAAYKVKMSELEETYLNRRNEMEKQLAELQKSNEFLQDRIERYKREHIENKKLYIKHLVYA